MTSFTHDGKEYTLQMTRAGLRAAETSGLNASEIAEKPFSAIVGLFFASLHSRYHINPNKAAKMLDDLFDSGQLQFESLFEELSEAYTELFGLGGSED